MQGLHIQFIPCGPIKVIKYSLLYQNIFLKQKQLKTHQFFFLIVKQQLPREKAIWLEKRNQQLPTEIELQVLDQETESQTVKDVLRYPTKERKD